MSQVTMSPEDDKLIRLRIIQDNQTIIFQFYTIDNNIIGLASLEPLKEFKDRDLYLLSKLLIRKENRRNGFGCRLLRHVCNYADNRKLRLICDAIPDGVMTEKELVHFYYNEGFIERDTYFIADSILTSSMNESCALIRAPKRRN